MIHLKRIYLLTGLYRLDTQTFWLHLFSSELPLDFLCELKIKQFVITSLFIEILCRNQAENKTVCYNIFIYRNKLHVLCRNP
jgi:hypothetical protein